VSIGRLADLKAVKDWIQNWQEIFVGSADTITLCCHEIDLACLLCSRSVHRLTWGVWILLREFEIPVVTRTEERIQDKDHSGNLEVSIRKRGGESLASHVCNWPVPVISKQQLLLDFICKGSWQVLANCSCYIEEIVKVSVHRIQWRIFLLFAWQKNL